MNPGDVFTIDYETYYIFIVSYDSLFFSLKCSHDFMLAPAPTLLTVNNQALTVSNLVVFNSNSQFIVLDKILDDVFWNFITSESHGMNIVLSITKSLIDSNLIQEVETANAFKAQLAHILKYKND